MIPTVGSALAAFDLEPQVHEGIRIMKASGPGMVYAKLAEWRFALNGRVLGRWGLCNYTKRTIEVHALLSDHPVDFKATLIHEVAHALDMLVYGCSSHHGARWRSIMRCLGAPPLTTHSDAAMAAFVALRERRAYQHWRCTRCGHKVAILKRRKHPAHMYRHGSICRGNYAVV